MTKEMIEQMNQEIAENVEGGKRYLFRIEDTLKKSGKGVESIFEKASRYRELKIRLHMADNVRYRAR